MRLARRGGRIDVGGDATDGVRPKFSALSEADLAAALNRALKRGRAPQDMGSQVNVRDVAGVRGGPAFAAGEMYQRQWDLLASTGG